MSKRTYLALTAHDNKPSWQEPTQFLMILELNNEILQELEANIQSAAPLASNPNAFTLNFNFNHKFFPLGENREETEANLERLRSNTDLRTIHGDLEDLLETREDFVIFTVDSNPFAHIRTYEETYANQMHCIPFKHLSFSFGGAYETEHSDGWSSHEQFNQSHVTRIRETFEQNA